MRNAKSVLVVVPTNTFQRKSLLTSLSKIKDSVKVMLLDSCLNEIFECTIIEDLQSVKSISRKEIVINSTRGQISHPYSDVDCVILPLKPYA